MINHFDVAVIGGGILGSSIAYFLATSTKSKVIVLEQEGNLQVEEIPEEFMLHFCINRMKEG